MRQLFPTFVAASMFAASPATAEVILSYDSCGYRTLDWSAVDGAVRYTVERRECDGCINPWRLLSDTQTTEVDDADQPAIEYRVRAVGASGNIISTQSTRGDGRQVNRLSIQTTRGDLPSLACGETLRLEVLSDNPPDQGAVAYDWIRNGEIIATTQVPYLDIEADAALSGKVLSVVAKNDCSIASAAWPPYIVFGMPRGMSVYWASLSHEEHSLRWYSIRPSCMWCCGGLPPEDCECSQCWTEHTSETQVTNTPCNPVGLGESGAFLSATASQHCTGFFHDGAVHESVNTTREVWSVSGILPHDAIVRVQHSLLVESACSTVASITQGDAVLWEIDGSAPPVGVAMITIKAGEFALEVRADSCQDPFCWSQEFGGVDAGVEVELLILDPSPDCNSNQRPDFSDISSGASLDMDQNSTPDECQTVDVPGDFATIQAAIDAAPANEMRIVSVAAGTFNERIAFNGKPVVVRGAGAGQTVIAGAGLGGESVSVVRFTGGEPAIAALERVSVRGGATGSPFPGSPQFLVGGGIFGYQSAASIRDCVIEQNVASFGAGAYLWTCTGNVERCVFRNNNAGSDGGGVQLYRGTPTMVDCVVEGNICNSRGGGMHIVHGNPTLTRVAVRNNYSNNLIGGVSWFALGSATATAMLDDCTVTGNSALVTQGGIGISAPTSGTPTITLRGTEACDNAPRPNVSGLWADLGGNVICDCAGDLTFDGVVNGADLGILLSAWGACGGSCASDLNRDGVVNGADLGAMLSEWGLCGE
jgi:hypothetical protein